jgi:hypothetical protein
MSIGYPALPLDPSKSEGLDRYVGSDDHSGLHSPDRFHRSVGATGSVGCAQYRTIEVKGHTRKSIGRQTLKNQIFRFAPNLLDTDLIGTAQRARDDRRIRQSPGTEHSPDHLIIAVIVYIPQFPVANDQMYHQQHHSDVMTINRADLQVTETSPQLLLEFYAWKEVLKEVEAGI